MEVEDTLLQDSSRGMSIERGESFEVEDPPRLKRSKLLSGRSGGTDSVMDAFFSGFKTSLSASAGGDVVDGENGDSSQRDSSALISKDDELCSNQEGENSARENPFDRNHGSDSRVRFLDSEEGGVVTADGGSRESWTVNGGALANGSAGHGDQDTILDDLRDGRGDEAEREAPGLDGSEAGRFGSSDDRSDYLAGRNQRGVEMDFEAGSAARDGDVSVQYPPQSSVGEYPAFTTPSRSPRDYSADSLDLSSTGSASADGDSVLENVLSKRASLERGESFEVAEKFTVKRSQFSKSRGTHGSGFLGDFHVSLADCLEDRAEKDASDLNATRAQSVSSETHEPDKAAGRSFEFADNEQKSSAPSFDQFGAGESRSQATELSFSDNFLDSFTSESRSDEFTDEIQPSVTKEQFTNDCSDPPLSQGTRSAQNIHEDTSSVSQPRRLSSAPSVERGESFEVSTPRMLRRQDRHGFVMGSGGFHTSFHSLVREEDDSATAAHRADRDDNCGDPEDPGSASWTERAISTAQDAYSSLERKLRRESGKKMQKLESYNRDNASSANDNDDVGRDGSSDEGNSSEDSESDDKDEDSASSPHSAAEEDEGEEADANADDRAKSHVKSDSFEYVHASALMARPRMRSQSEDILEEQGTGAEDLETTPSGGLATPRSNSVTMEQVREVSHIVMNNPVISDQGDSLGDDSTNRAIERAFRTDSITTEIDTSVLFPTETIAPATGSAPSKRLSSTPSIERGESFEVSAPRQLRHQTHQGFSVGAGGFHTSFHASLEEEAEEEEEEEEEEKGAPLEQNDQDVVSDETAAKSEDPNSPGWLEKAATVAKDAYSVLETKLNMKSKKKPKGDMDEREEDQDEENSGSDEDENSHAEDGELSTSLQTSPDGSKVHEEDTQFTGRADSNDMLSMEKEQEEATTVTSADVPVSAEDHSFNQEASQENLLQKDAHGETFAEEEEQEGGVDAKTDSAATVSHEDPDSPESAEAAVIAEDHSFSQEAEQEDLLKKDTQSETFVSGMEFQADDNAELWPLDIETSAAEVTVTSPAAPLKSAPSIERGESFEVSAPKTLRHQGGRGFLVGPGGFQTSFHSTAEDYREEAEEEEEGGVNAKSDAAVTVSHEDPNSSQSAEAAVSAEDHSFNQEAEQEDLLKKDAHGETVASGMEFQADDNEELWPLNKETSAAEETVTSHTAPLKSAPSIERGESFEVSAPKTLRHQGGRGFLVGPGGFQTSFHSTAEDYREEEEEESNVDTKTEDAATVAHEDPNSPSWMQRVVSAAKDTYSSLEKKMRRRRKIKSPNDSGCVDHDIEGDHEDADDDTDSLDESEGETGSEEDATNDNYRHIKVEEKTDTNLQKSSDNLVTELQTTEFAEQDSWTVTSPDKLIEVKDETAINLQNSPDNRVSESQTTELAEQENLAVTSPDKLIEVEKETATNLQTSPDNLVTESQRTDIAEQENWAVTSPDRLIEVEEETATNLQTSPANLVSESQTGELAEQDNMAVASPSSSPSEYQALPTRRHSHDVFGATPGGDTSPKQARRSSTELKPSFERLSSVGRAYSELRKDAWLPGRQNTNPFVDSDEDSPQVNEHTESTRQDAVSSERLSVKRTNTNPFIDDVPEDAMSKGGECARPFVRENTNPFLEDIAAEANPENSSDATSLPAASFDEIFEDVKKQTDEDLESSSSKDPGSLELRRSLFRSRGQKKETLNSSNDQSSQFTSVTTSSSNNTSTGLSDSTSEQEEDKLFSPGNPFAIPEFSGDLSPVTEACESSSYRSFGYPVDDSPDTDKILRFGSDDEDASRTRTDADSFGDDNVTAETEASFPPARLTESDRNSSITSSNFSQSVSMEAFENSFVSSTAQPSAELPTGQSLHDELATATRHSEPFSSQYEPGFHLTTSGTSLQVSDQGDLLGEEERANSNDEPFEVDIESHINVEMEPEQPLAHDPSGRKSRSLSLPLGDGMHRKMNATTWDRAYLTRYRSFGDSGQNTSARGRLSSTRSFDSYRSSPWSPTRDPDLGKSTIVRSVDGSDDQDLLAGTNKTVFAAQDAYTSAEKPLRGRKANKGRAGGQEHPVGVGDEHERETESDDEDESGSDESLTQGEYVLEPEITGHDRATFHGKLPLLEEEPSAQWLLREESSPRVKTSLQGSPKAHGIVGLAEDNANQSTAAELSQGLLFTQEADSFSRKWEQSFEASALTESATSNGEQWNAFDASSADAFLEGTHDTIQASAREDVFASPLSAGESKMPRVDEGEQEPSTSAERPRSLSRDANYSRQTSQPKPSPEDEAYQIMQTLSDLTKMWNEENAGDDTADVASAEYIQSGGDHPLSFTSRVVSFSRENSADPEAVFEDAHVDNYHEEKERQHFIFPEPVTELAETAPEDRVSSAEVLSRSGAPLTNTDSTIVSVSSSKLESSAPSVERGESFEMSTQKTLRRQPGHGFFVGAGGFQASFPFPADGEDLKNVPVEPQSPSWTEKVAAAAKDAYDSLGRKLRRPSKNKKGTGESYGQEEEGSCSEDAANSSETSSDLSTEEEESASQPIKETAEEMSLIPTDDVLKTRHQHDNAFSAMTQETLSSAATSWESEFKEDQITSAPSSAVAAVEPNDQKLQHLSSLAVDHSPDLTFPTENLKDESGNNEQSELQSAEDSEDDLQPLLLAQTFEKTEGRPLVEDKWGVSEAGSSVLQAANLRTWSLEKQQDLSNVQEAFCTNLEVSRTDVCAEESAQDHETAVEEDNRDENKYATRVPPNSLEDSEAHETRSGEFDQENNGCEEDVFTASTDALKNSSSERRPSSVSSKSSSSSDSRPQSRSSDVLRDQARTVNSYERLQSEPEELPVDVINSDMVFTNSSMVVEEGYDDFIPSRNDRTRIRLYQRSIGREGSDSHSNSEADDDDDDGDDGNRVYRRLSPTKLKPSKGLPLVTDPFVDYEADDDESCSERATPITEVKTLPGHQMSLDSDLSAGQEDLDVTEQATEEPLERSHHTGVHQEQSSATNKEKKTVVSECHAEGGLTADLLEQPAGSFSDVQEMPLSDYETQLRSTARNIVTAAVESAEKQAMESPLPEPDFVSEHREENRGWQEYPSLSPAQSEMQDRAVTFEEGTAMVQSPSAETHSPFVDDLVCLQQKPDAGYAEMPSEDKPKDAVYVAQPLAGNEETLSSTKTSSANTQSSSIDLLSSLDELPVNVQQNDIDDLSIFTEAETKQWGRNEWSGSSTDAAANAESVDSLLDEDQPERLAFPASNDGLHGLNKDSKKGVTASEKLMKLHAQPVFADTESSEMPAEETEIFPTRAERAAAARATLDQLSREFSESTDSAEASFSKSVDSLSLVNFESQAAAEIELAAQHGFMTSVDELDPRSLSALGVGPSSQTSTEDVAPPRLLSRDGALSISSFDVVPSPQASVDVMSPTVSSHDSALSISSFDVVPSPQTSVDVMSPTLSSRDGALSISSFDVVPSPQTSTDIMSPSSLSRDDVFSASSLDAVPPPQASSEDFMSPSQPSRDGVLSTSLDASPSPQGSTDAAAWSAQLSDDRNSAASEGQAEAAEQMPDARGVDEEVADRPGSPSWVDKAITTARNAYGSLESRFKRKSRKKENGEAGDGDQPEEGPSDDEEELGDDEDVEESGVDAEVRKEVSSCDVDELAAHQSDHEGSEQGVLEKQHGLLHIYDGEDAAASVEGAVNEDHAFAQAMPRNQLQRSDAFVAEFDIPASSTSPQISPREGTETGVQPNVVTVSPDYIEFYDHGSEYNGTALESASEVRDLPSSTDAPETAAVLRPGEDDAECIRETEDLRTSEPEKSSSLFAQTNTELHERFLSAEEQSAVAKPDVLSTAVDETEALASGELLVPEDGEAMADGRPDELVSDIADGNRVREQGEAADHCPGSDDSLVPWDSAATESETPVPDSVTALPVSDSECKDTELASEAGEQSSGMMGSAVQRDGFPDSFVARGVQRPDDVVVLGEAAERNLDVDPHSSGDLMQPENTEQPYEDETLPAETVEATAETQVTAEVQSFKDQPETFGFDLSSEDSAKASVADDTSQEFTADSERPAEVQPHHTDHNLQTLSSMEAAEPLSQTQPSHPRPEYESSEFFERSLPSRTGATSELSQSVGSAGSALQPEEQNITLEHSAFQSDASIATGETAEGLEEDVHQEGESASCEGSQGFMTSSTAAVSQLPESGELHTTVEGLVDSREQTAMLEASSYQSDAIRKHLSDDESVADARGQPEEEIRSDSSETKQRFVEVSDVASSQLPEFSESEWSTVGAAQLEQQVLSMNQADLRSSAQTATLPSDDESSKRPEIHPDYDEFRHETSETSQISTTSLDQMTWQAPDTTEHREQDDGIEEDLVAADHIPSESTLPSEHTDDGGRSSPSWMERAMIAAKDAYGSLEKRLRRKKKTKVVLGGETVTEKLEEEGEDEEDSWEEDSTDAEDDRKEEQEEKEEDTGNTERFPQETSFAQQTPSDDTSLTETNVTAMVQATELSAVMEHSPDWANSTDFAERTLEGSGHTIDAAERTLEGPDHTIDAVERTLEGHDHTIDAVERTQEGSVHTTDAVERTLEGPDHTIDAAERTLEGPDHTIDAVGRTLEGPDHTIDAAERTLEGPDHTIDAVGRTLEGPDHTIDAAERTLEGSVYSTDAAERILKGPDHTIDAVERTLEGHDHTIDAVERTLEGHDHTIDAVERTLEGPDHTIDAVERTLEGHDHTIDAVERTLEGSVHTTDAVERTLEGPDHTIDAAERTLEGPDHTIDAVGRTLEGSVYSTDAAERILKGPDHATDDVERTLGGSDNSTDAAERTLKGPDHSTDAVERTLEGPDHTIDAVERTLEGPDHTIDAVERTLEGHDHTIDAVERTLEGSVHTTDAVERTLEGPDHTIDAAERTLEGPDHTIDAVGRTLEGSVYSTDAAERILKGPDHATDDVERTLGGSDNSTDAAERTLKGPDHSTDAVERTLEGPDHTIDAVERTLEGPDHTIDAVERTLEGHDHTIDAVERTLEGSVHTTDAVERTLEGPDHTIDAAEKTLEGPDHTIDAVGRTLEGSVYSTDAAERILKGPDHATDDVERTLGGSDNSTDAAERTLKGPDHSTDAVDRTLEGPDHTIDAVERTLEGPDHTIDAVERTLEGHDHTIDAVERTLEGPDHTTDAVERTLEGPDHTIDAVQRTLEGSVYSTDAAETTLEGPDHSTDAVERTLKGPDSDTQEVRSAESFATMSLAGDVLVEQLSTPARNDLAEETERDIGGETAESVHVQYYGAEDTQKTLADSVDTVEAAHFNNDSSAWVQEDSKQLMSQSLQSQKLSNEEERSTSMDNEYHEVSNTARVEDRNLQDVAEPFAETSSMVVMASSERPEIGDEDGYGSSKEQEEDHRLNKEEDTTSPTSYRDAYFTALAEREDITVTSEDLQTSQSLPMSHQPPSSSENEQRTLAATEVSKSEAMYRDTYFSALAEKGLTSYTADILHTEPAVSENRQQDSEPISLKDEGDGQPEENSSEPDYNVAVMDAVRKADKRLVTRLSTEFSLQTNIFDTEDQDAIDADRHHDVFDQGTDGRAGDLSPGEDTVTQHRSAEDDQRFLARSSEELTLPIAQEDTCSSEALSSVSLVPPGTSMLREEQQTETFVQSSEEELKTLNHTPVGDQERNKAEQATAKDTEPDYAVTVIDAVLGADKSLREEQPSLAGAAVADEQVEPNNAVCGVEQIELNDASFGDEQVEPADAICGDEQMEPTDASFGDYEESRETSSDDVHPAEQRAAEVQSRGGETGTLTTADVDTASQPQAELVDDNRFRDDEESLICSYVNEHKQNLLIGSTEATEVLPSTLSTETEYYADKTIADGEIFETEETEENQRLTDKDEADTLRTNEPETSHGSLEDMISSQAVAPVREHDEDADDTARDEQTPLEPAQELEHIEDGGRSSPSWMQKAMTAAKEAYGSLEKRLRRKKKKKAADDGSTGTEDVEEDSGVDEYTDTEDDSEEGANDDAVTTENVTVLNAAHPVAGHFKLQDDDDFRGEELQTGQSPPQTPQFSSEREQRELTGHTATRAEYSGVTHAGLPETGMMATNDVRMEMSFTGQGSSTEDAAHLTQDFGETQKHLPTDTESFDRELSRNEDEAVDEMTITATITGHIETSPSSGPYVTFPDENDHLQSRQDYKTQVYTSEDDERYLNVNDGITADSNESHDNQPEQQSIEMMVSDDSLLTRQESATIQRHASEDGRADLDDIDAAAENTHHDVVAQSDWQGREMVSTGSFLQSESIHAHQYSSENEQKVLEGGGSETVVAEADKLFQKEVESSVSNQNSNEDTQNDFETNPETAFHKDVSDMQFECMQEAEIHAEKHEKTESLFRGNSEDEQNTVTEDSEPPIHLVGSTDGKAPGLLERDLSSGDIYQHDQISSEPQPLSSENEQKTLEGDSEAILHNAGSTDAHEMETVAAASSSTQSYISEDEQPFLPRDADSSIDASHQFSADSRQEGDGHSGGASLHLDFATPQFSSEDEQRSLQEDQKSTVEAAPQYSSESQQREELSESVVQLLQQQISAARPLSSEAGQRSLQGAAESTVDASTVQQRSSESWQGDGFSVGDSLCLQEPNVTTSQNVSSEDGRRSLQEDAQASRTEVSNHEGSSQQGDGFDEGVAFRLQETSFASQRESSEDGQCFIPGDTESTIEASRQLSSEDWQGDESGESAILRLQETSFASQHGSSEDGRRSMPGDTDSTIEASHRLSSETWQGDESGEGATLRLQETSFASQHGSSEDGRRFMPGDTESTIEASHRLSSEAWQGDETDENATLRLQETSFASQRESSEDGRLSLPGDTGSTIEASHRLSSEAGSDESATLRLQKTNQRESSEDGRLSMPGDTESTIEASHQLSSETWQGDESGESATLRLQKTSFAPQRESSEDGRLSLPGNTESTLEASRQPSSEDWQGDESGESVRLRLQETSFPSQRESSEDGRLSLPGDTESTIETSRQLSSEAWQGDEFGESATLRLQQTNQCESREDGRLSLPGDTESTIEASHRLSSQTWQGDESDESATVCLQQTSQRESSEDGQLSMPGDTESTIEASHRLSSEASQGDEFGESATLRLQETSFAPQRESSEDERLSLPGDMESTIEASHRLSSESWPGDRLNESATLRLQETSFTAPHGISEDERHSLPSEAQSTIEAGRQYTSESRQADEFSQSETLLLQEKSVASHQGSSEDDRHSLPREEQSTVEAVRQYSPESWPGDGLKESAALRLPETSFTPQHESSEDGRRSWQGEESTTDAPRAPSSDFWQRKETGEDAILFVRPQQGLASEQEASSSEFHQAFLPGARDLTLSTASFEATRESTGGLSLASTYALTFPSPDDSPRSFSSEESRRTLRSDQEVVLQVRSADAAYEGAGQATSYLAGCAALPKAPRQYSADGVSGQWFYRRSSLCAL